MAASPSGTVIAVAGQTLIDSGNMPWTMNIGKVFEQLGSNTALLLFVNNKVYRKTTSGVWGWWRGAWITCMRPVPTSDDDTTIPGTNLIVDADGNLWGLSDGQVTENGVPDVSTSGAELVLFWGGQMYYQNHSAEWFVWNP